MRKLLPVLSLLLLATSSRANSWNPFSQFASQAQTNLIKPFALDLGGVLGESVVETGRTYGVPGFWAGPVFALQNKPDSNDLILRSANVTTFGMPMLQVGVGLPFKTDVILHGVGAYGASVFGGGVRTSLHRTDAIDFVLPSVSVSAFADKVNDSAFNAYHYAADATASWNIPVLKPFIEAGYDVTKVTVGAASTPSVVGASATAQGSRFSLGADLTIFPFTNFRLAYSELHGIPGAQVALGITF